MAQIDVAASHQPRAYQLEMLHESLKRNIIVAMDTGSGKTKVAVLRIAEEMRRNPDPSQLVWFLCPGVQLAEQQHMVLRTQLPALPALLLLGRDGVDHWSTQRIWDDILRGQRIVVSTFQVLLDALKHAFVTMSRLSLLVVDEAHHCAGGHPLNQILQGFYHPAKMQKSPVPAILGLTATPVMKSKVQDLTEIEANLDAISRTPKASLESLLLHVHRPAMIPELYEPSKEPTEPAHFDKFKINFLAVRITDDPYVKYLSTTELPESRRYIDAAVKRRTWCQGLLRSIVANATQLQEELGAWASDQYLIRCRINLQIERAKLDFMPLADKLHKQELDWMLAFFDAAGVPSSTDGNHENTRQIAAKAAKLIEVIVREMRQNSAAIVFVQTKATVQLLFELLRSHCHTKDLLRIGKLVGLSKGAEKSGEVNDIYEVDDRAGSGLMDLRSGKKNLLVCTSVAEEGLDISACNLVICFEQPKSMKSFVQRRGRARATDSRYIVLFDATEARGLQNFQALEEQMKLMYQDETRVLDDKARKEGEMTVNKILRVGKASLRADDAFAHLQHFTAKLPTTKFGNALALCTFTGPDEEVVCTIVLPNTVDISIRTWKSSRPWPSEKQARNDAAFIAYTGLYNAGLVNDNLLPNPVLDDQIVEVSKDIDPRAGLATGRAQHDPMRALSEAWSTAIKCYAYACEIPTRNLRLFMFLPMMVQTLPPVRIYLDQTETFEVTFSLRGCHYTSDTVEYANRTTRELLMAMFSNRMEPSMSRFPILFTPTLDSKEADIWLNDCTGLVNIRELLESKVADKFGNVLVRQRKTTGRPAIFVGFEDQESFGLAEDGSHEKFVQPCVKCVRMPARTDLLHSVAADKQPAGTESKFHYIPVQATVVDRMQPELAFFASLIPSIMHHIGRRIIAQELCANLLSSTGLRQPDLILVAITTTSAHEDVNYQRIEFLGDAVLGFCVSIYLLAQFPLWHEGYLTRAKEHCVSNTQLAKASQETGLAQYILTTGFTGLKWRPPHNDQYQQADADATRTLPTKTMADVVEALIGVADVVGGIATAFTTIETLLGRHSSGLSWKGSTLESRVAELQGRVPMNIKLPPHLVPMQELVGHMFKRPALLLEAITHNSFTSESAVSSYERLEFAGDSILGIIVTRLIHASEPALDVDRMHLLRTAAVNGHFLAFMSLRHTVNVTRTQVVRPDKLDRSSENGGCSVLELQEQLCFHDFILHYPSEHFTAATKSSVKRFETLRPEIEAALEAGKQYPWKLLASFCPEKWFSDIVESILCAIFIDSDGSFDACTAFLERLGVIAFLNHAIATNMWVMQPKQELNKTNMGSKMIYQMVDINEEGVRDEVEQAGLDEEDTVACRLFMAGKYMCTASGRERFVAETKAAEKGLKILRAKSDS